MGDHAEELWKGVQSGAKILADSITGTAEALIEDPLGTGGQMAYDATIGTVEEVIDTAVWGTKLVFDVGDTREQFDEKWNAEQDKINQMGMSGYLGEKGAIIVGGAALRRVGVKNKRGLKPDSGRGKDSGEGTDKTVPSYGKNSVPVGPYREVDGYPIKVKSGAQEKHIPNTPNYNQELANGKNKSIFYGDNTTAQELLDKFAGNGDMFKKGKERVDFGRAIGKYYDKNSSAYIETTKGIIHYGKDGAHIVPAAP